MFPYVVELNQCFGEISSQTESGSSRSVSSPVAQQGAGANVRQHG